MKRFLLVVFLILSVTFFAKTKVVFWHAMGGGHGEVLNQIVKAFNESQPNIVVEAVYIGNYSALQQKLLAGAQAGQLPTISQAYSNWTAKLLQSGIVEPLNKYMNDPKIGITKQEWEDVFKAFRDNCTWGNTVYAVPFNKSLYIMYYNATALSAAGISVPKSINELLYSAKVLTKDKNKDGKPDVYGFAFRTTVDTFQIFLMMRGGEIVKLGKDGKYVSAIDSPETREVLQFFKKLLDDKVAFAQGGYLNDIFGQGTVLMYIDTIAGRPYVEQSTKGKFQWAWAPVPVWKTRNVPFAGTDIIMFSTAKEEEKRAAWEFMKYLISPEVTAYWAVNTGYLPVRRAALQTTIWKQAAKSDPLLEIPLQQIDNAKMDPQLSVWTEIRNVVSTMFNDFINGKVDMETAIKRADAEIKKYLAEEYK
ncbi:ABC transporter substrate-binding protein [Fervidobacterium thailandense]|uniref:Sugar ABC transporter substrate-binding protein n=1 Tax=Fervidobacterium thailandense TaxID=1008305 RepID=A0A1E3G3P1_9BACT|nr:ABC transporter substrate-binding protein [Fervidobacterium thailandense]ODN30874.1 sugar ABC transporter substrate-binding protein [Fervidobacterium thailandense]